MKTTRTLAIAALAIGLLATQAPNALAATPDEVIGEIKKLVVTIVDDTAEPMRKSAATAQLSGRQSSLEKLGPEAVAPVLKAVASEKIELLRVNLLISLWKIASTDPTAIGTAQIPALIKLRGDKAYPVGYWALKILSTSKDRRATKLVIDALAEKDTHIIRLALDAIVKRADRTALNGIRPLLKDKRALIRIEAITALKQLAAKKEVEFIIPLLNDPDPIVRGAAVGAVEKLTGKLFGIVPEDDNNAVQQRIDAWIKANK